MESDQPSRRQFMRRLGHDSIRMAGTLGGLLSQARGAATAGLTTVHQLADPLTPLAPSWTDRPFRLSHLGLQVISRSALPILEYVDCADASALMGMMRRHQVLTGSYAGSVSLNALAATMTQSKAMPPSERVNVLRSSARLLRSLDPTSGPLANLVGRLEGLIEGPENTIGPTDVRLQAAAEQEAESIDVDTLVLSRALTERLSALEPPLSIVVHGHAARLTGAAVVPALRELRESGRDISVFVLEARPSAEGHRITSPAMVAQGVEHEVVADGAVAPLMEAGLISAVVIGASLVSNDYFCGPPGSLGLTIMAGSFGVPVLVTAPTAAFVTSEIQEPPDSPPIVPPFELLYARPWSERVGLRYGPEVIPLPNAELDHLGHEGRPRQ